MISKLLVITDGCSFYKIKETDNNEQQVHHSRWQSFQFRFNSWAEIVCNQPNLSRIFGLHNNSANPNISRIFFRLQIGGLASDPPSPPPSCLRAWLEHYFETWSIEAIRLMLSTACLLTLAWELFKCLLQNNQCFQSSCVVQRMRSFRRARLILPKNRCFILA